MVIDGPPLAGWRVCEGAGGQRGVTTHYLSAPCDPETLASNIEPLLGTLVPAQPGPVSSGHTGSVRVTLQRRQENASLASVLVVRNELKVWRRWHSNVNSFDLRFELQTTPDSWFRARFSRQNHAASSLVSQQVRELWVCGASSGFSSSVVPPVGMMDGARRSSRRGPLRQTLAGQKSMSHH